MPRKKKPTPTKKQDPMAKMIEDCVKKAQARKRSGQTDREWRERYASSLKTDDGTVPLSQTPFAGDTFKKKV